MSADPRDSSVGDRIAQAAFLAVVAIIAFVWLITACLAPKPDYPPGVDCYHDGFSTVCEP